MDSHWSVAACVPIGRILPVGREDRWSDLLAVLIDTDPDPILGVLGLCVPGPLEVVREAAVDAESRPDIVLRAGGRALAVIEVKLLAGFGRRQLARYVEAEPGADAYVVLHPGRLALPPGRLALPPGDERWRAISWEDVLAAHRASKHPWVAATASAWQERLTTALPVVGPDTVWNELEPGEDFKVALRARMSWVHDNLRLPDDVHYDIATSSAGRSWVVRVMKSVPAPGYRVQAEIEERLPVRSFPERAGPDKPAPRGPRAMVALIQSGVSTSAGFDWAWLHAMWTESMSKLRSDWDPSPARPRAGHDQAAHQRIVELGAPQFLGAGFGDQQTQINGECMFGARFSLPPDIRLSEVATEMSRLAEMVVCMSEVQRPEPLRPGC
jgi:hypothetical protein